MIVSIITGNKTILCLMFISIIVLSSCDPGFEEVQKINNKSNKNLTFTIRQNILKGQDVTLLQRNNAHLNISKVKLNDSVYTFNLDVDNNSFINLHSDGGIGNISFFDDHSAKLKLNMLYDTIYIISHVYNNNIYDFSIWDRETKKKRLSSSSFFTLNIKPEDIQ